ncbi:hypothetical protein EST38_g11544 [Candolleomyces aberdarensis]|uniref:Uncharacterized protein n=1 Tax=Candolleomyces aberdarensis TaxID=2316362 RepID=A0A4Q2D633_9AGAR|nr:hypothetical protein EST38_g11544 [Candolleomyces aberdarensis]
MDSTSLPELRLSTPPKQLRGPADIGIPARSGESVDEVSVARTPAFRRGFEEFVVAPDAAVVVLGFGFGFEALDYVCYGG